MSSTEPYAPPSVWGRGIVGLTDEWFSKRVGWCRSVAHCRAAIEAEIARGQQPDRTVRRDRIATLNQRVAAIKRMSEEN